MKNNRLPLYILFVLVGAAIVWRIANPPATPLPGPVGTFPTWKSTATQGHIAAQTVNPAGTLWAGAWNQELSDGKTRSALRIIDFNGYSAKSVALPDGAEVQYLTWADDNTLRVCCGSTVDRGKGLGLISVDAAAGKVQSSKYLAGGVARILSWPKGSSTFLAESGDVGAKGRVVLAAFSDAAADGGEVGKMIGKAVTLAVPRGGALYTDAGVAADGSSFVFSLNDPAAKEGRSFYLADTATGVAVKAFDLGDIPGRLEGIWSSEAGVLLICNVKGKLVAVLYDPATGKLAEQPKGIGDLAKWPGAPKTIAMTNYDGGFEFDLATGKTKIIIDMRKRQSEEGKFYRDLLRDSRVYRLKSGNFVTVSESGGGIDIREIKPDGGILRALLSRM